MHTLSAILLLLLLLLRHTAHNVRTYYINDRVLSHHHIQRDQQKKKKNGTRGIGRFYKACIRSDYRITTPTYLPEKMRASDILSPYIFGGIVLSHGAVPLQVLRPTTTTEILVVVYRFVSCPPYIGMHGGAIRVGERVGLSRNNRKNIQKPNGVCFDWATKSTGPLSRRVPFGKGTRPRSRPFVAGRLDKKKGKRYFVPWVGHWFGRLYDDIISTFERNGNPAHYDNDSERRSV